MTDEEKAKELLDQIILAGEEEFRRISRENIDARDAALKILMKHPDWFNKFSPNNKILNKSKDILCGIDKQSRAEAEEIDQNYLDESARARIKEIEADPAYINRHDKRHNKLIKERVALYAGNEPESNNNGD